MKVAVSSTGPTLDSAVDPRFGRCQCFLIVDLDDMSFEALDNASIGQQGGAGIQSAKVVVDQGVKAVLTGNVGPNAYQVLSEVGLEVITGVAGTVRDAAQQYKEGHLKPAQKPNVENHFGMGSLPPEPPSPDNRQTPATGFGTGRGMGGGGGRGMGGGRGRGCGRGIGCGRGMGPMQSTSFTDPPSSGVTGKQDLAALKEQARLLRAQMDEIQSRIKEAEKKKP